ncbi:MAG TPA: molybdate ABC transporter substrate-binding protein [Pirellulales bacterium]|nr:molybdate ABC transporter substrate-binding protein [Pirellulales bacterium]
MQNAPAWENDWSIRLRIWVERNGEALLGPGRLELLEAIDRCQSISGAARQVGISYRHAWLLVQGINRAAGKPLVTSAVGGQRGGGARLTELGKHAVASFCQLQQEMHTAAAQILPRVLDLGQRTAAVHVAAAISLEQVLGQLLADHVLRQPAVRVRAIYGASNELADHTLAGAPCDLFISADAAQVERLRRAGLCQANAPRVLARNGLAIVAPADATIALRHPKDLLRADVGRVALADPESPLGSYTRDYLTQLGLGEGLRDRLVTADSSGGVLATLESGGAEVGLVYTSDAARSNRIRVLSQPRSEAVVAEYWAVVPENAASAGPARRLLDFLQSPAARRRFRSFGFHPVKSTSRTA